MRGEEDIDAINIDDLSIDTHDTGAKMERRFDLKKYMDQRADRVTFCTYCRKKELYESGVLSIIAKNDVRDRNEPPVWFCCECCVNMYKHETGVRCMPEELFKDTFKRSYPAMYEKRYAV